ncbi:hypothetical protein FRIGORI9N_40048 [Frigoribacterium sp. 9N]|nr:hypothetical protein FRIGORI9N_40048 [Frigoribacterium sp. 9N]
MLPGGPRRAGSAHSSRREGDGRGRADPRLLLGRRPASRSSGPTTFFVGRGGTSGDHSTETRGRSRGGAGRVGEARSCNEWVKTAARARCSTGTPASAAGRGERGLRGSAEPRLRGFGELAAAANLPYRSPER